MIKCFIMGHNFPTPDSASVILKMKESKLLTIKLKNKVKCRRCGKVAHQFCKTKDIGGNFQIIEYWEK